MPTPVGHALAGLAVAGIVSRALVPKPAHVAVLLLCATAPDLDLLLRFVDGVNHHRGATHSLAAAALVGLIGGLLGRWGFDLPGGASMAAAWASHVVLDYFGIDTNPPFGEMALWPMTADFFIAPLPLFYDVSRAFTAEAIGHNMIAVLIELAVLLPVTLVCWRRFLSRKADPQ